MHVFDDDDLFTVAEFLEAQSTGIVFGGDVIANASLDEHVLPSHRFCNDPSRCG